MAHIALSRGALVVVVVVVVLVYVIRRAAVATTFGFTGFDPAAATCLFFFVFFFLASPFCRRQNETGFRTAIPRREIKKKKTRRTNERRKEKKPGRRSQTSKYRGVTIIYLFIIPIPETRHRHREFSLSPRTNFFFSSPTYNFSYNNGSLGNWQRRWSSSVLLQTRHVYTRWRVERFRLYFYNTEYWNKRSGGNKYLSKKKKKKFSLFYSTSDYF